MILSKIFFRNNRTGRQFIVHITKPCIFVKYIFQPCYYAKQTFSCLLECIQAIWCSHKNSRNNDFVSCMPLYLVWLCIDFVWLCIFDITLYLVMHHQVTILSFRPLTGSQNTTNIHDINLHISTQLRFCV